MSALATVADIGEELQRFVKDYQAGRPVGEIKVAIDKITDDILAMHGKYEDVCRRADQLEIKMNEKRGTLEEPGLADELLCNQAFQGRPKSLGRSQSIQFTLQSKNIISGVSRTLPALTGIVASGPEPILGVRSVLTVDTVSSGAVVYTRETAFTNNAAPVAEAAAKPQSDLTYTNVTLTLETLAHYIKVSRQAWEDSTALARAIERRMIYGLQQKEDNQLLNGNGTAPNLTGLMPAAPAAAAMPAGSTLVDALATAAGQLAASGYRPTAALVNPADWTAAMLVKDAQKQYVAVPPGLIPRVVPVAAMAAGSWLVGAFDQAATLFQREDATIMIASWNEDDFVKNLYTVLCELREGLAIHQPAALLKGSVPVLFEASETETPKRRV